ncbi:YciI family protein [Rufibacter ruber]|uniref:YciI family protein n=1 Tax=Rufibacter ruber TaxID=1783499 RepID=UPI000832C327|nr:YciI family protein [Rufibacter ruber]
MFLIELTYKVPFSEVEPFMAEHLAFVEKGYASGHFLASGRKVPRDGGLIFCQASGGKAELEELLQDDPFVYQDLVEYRILEFVTSRAEEGLKGLLA